MGVYALLPFPSTSFFESPPKNTPLLLFAVHTTSLDHLASRAVLDPVMPATAIGPPTTQAQASALNHELTVAKQQASDAQAAARNAEQQLLLAASGPPVTSVNTETAITSAAATALTAAAAAATATAAADATGGGAAPIAATKSIVTGSGIGLEIEKGPAADTLRLEELKAELQATTAAKKKVGVGRSKYRR